MEQLATLIGAALMLYAAWLLWQKAQRQPAIAYNEQPVTHTRSGYIPPTAPPRDISLPYQGRVGEGSFEDCDIDDGTNQTHTISQETLAAWAAADAADNQPRDISLPYQGRDEERFEANLPNIVKPSWGANLYEALGLDRTATPDQIRTAYREQCAVWHPDKNSDPAAANEFNIITQAYRTLTTQRAQYDAGLDIEEEITA